jgi:urease accessory protein
MAAAEVDAVGAWRGALSLRFASTRARTVVASRRHEGPFCIQQPFHPGDGVCHVYLLHPPGGLAAGDELLLDVEVDPAAAALLTTPASTKFYRSDGAASVQAQTLRVAAGASLEWLPLDTILFGGSRARISTGVRLDASARFIGWEVVSLGRPLSGDRYASGSFEQRTRIEIGGEPALVERLRWSAGERLLSAPYGLAGFGVCGALYAYPADDRLLALVRERLAAATHSSERVGATLLGKLLVLRVLGRDCEALRGMLERVWHALRPDVIGAVPSAPRIWKT